MDYKAAASRLRKNITIMKSTFDNNNLRVVNIGCKPYDDDDADLLFYVELESANGESIPCRLSLKINLYDSEGNLYMLEEDYLSPEQFNGYDTREIVFCDSSHVLEIARSGKIFVSRQ